MTPHVELGPVVCSVSQTGKNNTRTVTYEIIVIRKGMLLGRKNIPTWRSGFLSDLLTPTGLDGSIDSLVESNVPNMDDDLYLPYTSSHFLV